HDEVAQNDRAGGARGCVRTRDRGLWLQQLEIGQRRLGRPRRRSITRRGGTLNVVNHEDYEHIDPGQSYFAIDYEAVYATSRPLYSYKPNNFKEPVPDMAEGPAQISSDSK